MGSGQLSNRFVSVSDNGLVATAGSGLTADITSPDGALVNVLQLGSAQYPDDATLAGLALAPDGSKLFAVLANPSGADVLQVVDQPADVRSTLTLITPHSDALAGTTVALAGTLGLATGGPLPSGATVDITRTDSGVTVTLDAALPVGADGTFSYADPAPALGTDTYTASYSGDASSAISTGTASTSVLVQKDKPSLTLKAPRSVLPGGKIAI